jgi:hypothetical protein
MFNWPIDSVSGPSEADCIRAFATGYVVTSASLPVSVITTIPEHQHFWRVSAFPGGPVNKALRLAAMFAIAVVAECSSLTTGKQLMGTVPHLYGDQRLQRSDPPTTRTPQYRAILLPEKASHGHLTWAPVVIQHRS